MVYACFGELIENFKVWIDEFIIIATDEETLLKIETRFFNICVGRNLIFVAPISS